MKSTIAGIILLLGFWIFLLFGIANISYYKAFNDIDAEDLYSKGTYEDAVKVVDKGLASKDFKWIDEYVGSSSDEEIFFGRFNIQINDVYMKLSYIDYQRYIKYLKKKYKEYLLVKVSPEVEAPWSNL